MPTGYLIFEIEVTNQEEYDRYKEMAGPVLERHGGRFLVRNGRYETLEGGWTPPRFFVVEFDSYQAARDFYFSQAYQAALGQRLASSRSKAILIEGT
jgi:uncharacterized protein (DUF1330 family)